MLLRVGKLIGTLPPGRHTLDSSNIPFLSNLVDSFTGGRVFIEIAFDQGPAAREMAGGYPGWEEVRILKDHAGKDRVVTARRVR